MPYGRLTGSPPPPPRGQALRWLRHRRVPRRGDDGAVCTGKSNKHYWSPKLTRNKARDATHARKLRTLGWRVLVIWDCEAADANTDAKRLVPKLRRFLGEV
jgi:G:T-mismatch repair DNA endonuclease (very short patch repair protein)